jgi:excisionase family DNA binding protein
MWSGPKTKGRKVKRRSTPARPLAAVDVKMGPAASKVEPPITQVDPGPGRRRLINLKTACAYGGFGRTKAYELINAGVIEAYKMGHQTMVDLATLERYHASLPRMIPRGTLRVKRV